MKSILTIFILFGAFSFGTITTGHSNPRAVQNEARAGKREARTPNASRYRLDAGQSRFMIDANSSGLLWFLGHNHHIAAREFTGEAEMAPGLTGPASLQMTVKTASLSETGEHFTEMQKEIINGSMRKDVLETAKYPEALFKSTNIILTKKAENQFDARIEGQLTLHGVTRGVVIPARVILDGETLRASGKFEIDRNDYKIKTRSIKWGTIRVDDDMKLSFDIVARRD